MARKGARDPIPVAHAAGALHGHRHRQLHSDRVLAARRRAPLNVLVALHRVRPTCPIETPCQQRRITHSPRMGETACATTPIENPCQQECAQPQSRIPHSTQMGGDKTLRIRASKQECVRPQCSRMVGETRAYRDEGLGDEVLVSGQHLRVAQQLADRHFVH